MVVVLLLFEFGVSPGPLRASETRIVARYELGESQSEAERVMVALRLRLFNPGTEPLQDLDLRIEDSLRAGEVLATFHAVSVPPRGTVNIECDAVLPPREYKLWLAGGRPKLYLMVADIEGIPRPQPVELSRDRLDEHGDPDDATGAAPRPVHIQPARPDGAEGS